MADPTAASRFRHSLLQPTAALKTLLTTAASAEQEDSAAHRHFSVAARAVTELHRDIDAVTTFLLLEYGEPELSINDVTSSDILDGARTDSPIIMAAADRIELTSPLSVSFKSDARLISAALRALIANAVEFSSGPVSITVDANNDGTRFSVADRGIGLNEDVRQRIGTPFLVANAAKTNRPTRLGLGLPNAVRIAAALGGSITVSDRLGGGTEAALTIPSTV